MSERPLAAPPPGQHDPWLADCEVAGGTDIRGGSRCIAAKCLGPRLVTPIGISSA